MAAEGFIFYASFAEALEDLPGDVYKECITILSNYAIKGEEPEEMSAYAKMFFKMAKPQIDANSKRRSDGSKGGRPSKTSGYEENENQKPVVLESETSGFENENHRFPDGKPKEKEKVKENVNVNAKEKVKAKEKVNGGSPYPLTGVGRVEEISPEQLQTLGVDAYAAEALSEWILSRAEKGMPISESDFKAVVSTVKSCIQEYGVSAVQKQIQESMANGYKGLCLDRLARKSRADPDDPYGFQKTADAMRDFVNG